MTDVSALLAKWSALPAPIRRVVCVTAAVLVAISVAAGVFARPQRTPLFASALQPDQLGEVQERLAAWNVSFAPMPDNVLVDARRRSDLLLRLSMSGTPHAHVEGTNDVLARVGALTPQAVIDAQTRDGLAGDIELGLRGIEGVQDARVIIAPAKEGYFADDVSREATASVRLTMASGARLSPGATDGIRAFVAASVPGLDARSVTIVDDRGVALGEGESEDGSGDLQRSLQSALDAAIGPGAAIVRVHVDYDRRSVTSKDVRRAPIAASAIASNTQDERFEGQGKRYDRTEQQLDRGSETRETASTAQPGRIARITAAVFLDAAHIADVTQVKALGAATLGINPSRGDSLEVQAMNFTQEPVARKDVWWLAYGAIVPLLPALVIAAGILLGMRYASPVLTAAVHAANRRAKIARTAQEAPRVPAAGVRASLDGEPPHTAAAIISALPAATAAAVLEMYPEHERSAIIRRMNRPASPLFADAETFVART